MHACESYFEDDNQGKTGSMYVLLEKHKYFVCGLKIPAFAGTTM
jgi:hypothetical protein